MPVSFSRSAIIGVLLVLLALLAGCNALRLGYGQAPTLTYWWLDGYADFTDEQEPRVKKSVAEWFGWHRASQLTDYAAMLSRAQAEVLAPVTPDQLCRWHDDVLQKLATAAERALPALADTALSLGPEQLAHMEAKYTKVNQKFVDEFVEASASRRLKASARRAEGQAEKLYGALTAEQRELLAQGVAASPFNAVLSLSERKIRQAQTLAILRQVLAERPSADQVQSRLRVLVEQVRRSPRPAYRAYQDQLTRHHCTLAAQLHNSTSPAQRRVAAERLKGWESDFRALASVAVLR